MHQNRFFRLSSFRAKIYLVVVAAMLFAGAMNLFFIYPYLQHRQFESLRRELMAIAQTAALSIDAEKLSRIPLTHEGTRAPEFQEIGDYLYRIRQSNPMIRYIYTMTRTEKTGVWQFIVDVDAQRNVQGPRSCDPGDRYDAARFSEMVKGYAMPSADNHLELDEWGATLSGYAPVRDTRGMPVAILGIDITADSLYLMQREIRRRTLISVGAGIALFLIVGTFVSGRVSRPVKKLVEGARQVGDGNLDYTIAPQGPDELAELARAFNVMTRNLKEARVRLTNYFLGVAQSLVRALEAKDIYIHGHSERVAGHAEKIARRLDLPADKVELIRHTALLHDIGKLGIDESILSKKGPLTPEEWETVRRHPLIGEEILSTIALSAELPAIIRTHHARYDGKGYPEKSADPLINLCAEIIAAADAYDAMIYHRAYRLAIGKQAAVEEMKKHSGTQFNPRVVTAFLDVLSEEGSAKHADA